jgi:FkbM family methyltransferase
MALKYRTIGVRALGFLTRQLPAYRGARLLRYVHRPGPPESSVETIIRLESGLRFRANTSSEWEWLLFFYGADKYEPGVRALLRRCIRSGRSAIDVGANVGIHTVVMAEAVGKNGSVIACEPNPLACERLRANLRLNQLVNVEVHQVAVSSQAGSVRLYIPADQPWSSASSLQPNEHLKTTRDIPVSVTTLDALVAASRIKDVDLIKVDVEGLEAAVLHGANELLRRDHPVLIFEYMRHWWAPVGHSLEEVIEYLEDIGYTSFLQVTNRGLRRIDKSAEYMNVYASRGER